METFPTLGGRRSGDSLHDMKTVAFLREHGLDQLCERYAISAKRHGDYPSLVQLKYSQIDSPMAEPIVQECRGLILDESGDWRVVSRPYDKFFNHGEGHAATIDWSTARVYEKLDGSLMSLYEHNGQWHVASSGLPDAAGPVGGAFSGRFRDLFWKTWDQLGYRLPPQAHTDLTFMFELMTPYNRIIVRHEQPRIVLHGVRSRTSGIERSPEPFAEWMGWECVRSLPITSLSECLTAADALKPMECEGYVVRDENFRRVKIKGPQYVALAHIKEGMSLRRLIDIVRANESSEFLAYFPEFTDAYNRVRNEYDSLCHGLEVEYSRIRDLPTQKEFALEATKTRASAPLFAMRAGKVTSVREFFKGATVPSIERALGISQSELVDIQSSAV